MAENKEQKVLNVPNKREQNQTCLDSAEREGLRPKGNVPNLRFPEFKGEWEKCILGDITENFNLRNKDKIQYPMFSVTNDRGFVPQSEQFEGRDMVGEDIKAYKIIHTNDFAYNPARINVGSIAMYTGEKPCMISSLYVCFKTAKEVNNEWLMQLLKTPKMNYYYNINGEGGVRVYLFYPNFARIRMSIPKIEEQKKIAKLLNLIDERIATQNKIIDKLQSLIKGICNNYFEKLSVQEKANLIRLSDVLKERNEYSSKDGKFIHGTLSKDGIFPKTGRWDRDFLVKQEDKKYKVTHLDDICYNPANLKFGVICRNTFGDLIFSPIYVTFEVCKNVNIGFMELYLTNHNFIEKVRRFEQGTVYERMAVSPEDFLSYKIRIPSYSDQTFFYKKVQWLITLSQNEMKLLSQYKKLRQYLLRQMFI